MWIDNVHKNPGQILWVIHVISVGVGLIVFATLVKIVAAAIK